MRLTDYGLARGNAASLIVLNAEDLRETLACHSEPLRVIMNGSFKMELA